MESKTTSTVTALVLAVVSVVILVLSSPLPRTAQVPPTEGSVELASLGRDEVVSVRAEIVEEGPRGAEMVVYSTGSAAIEGGDSRPVTLDLPDGETVTLQGSDLASGKRLQLSERTAGYFRDQSRQGRAGVSPQAFGVQAFELHLPASSNDREVRIALEDLNLEEVTEEAAEGPSSPQIVLVLTAADYRFSEQDGWEVPLYVLAKRRLEAGGELAATVAPETMSILVEAPSVEPRTVTIEAGRPRSTEAVVLPLRRSRELEVTATDLAGEATAAKLALSWETHGPQSLVLEAYPAEAEGYATRLSPIELSARVYLDGKSLQTDRAMPLQVSSSRKLTVEPSAATLDAAGEPAALKVFGHGDGTESLELRVPDLDLEAQVTVHFRRPYLFLGLAALFGAVGVLAARRRHLFEQGRWAVAFELLAAITGGALLYAAFLMQWLPTPGFLIGAIPASAVGVLGGYAGEGVFQLLLRVTGLAK